MPQAAQATREAVLSIPALIHTFELAEAPPPALEPTAAVGTSASIPPSPTTSETTTPILSVTLPPTLLALIQDILGDFGCILRCFDRLGKKVESMD